MAETNEVMIYLRKILLEVVIPKKYLWEFMEEFGRAFAEKNILLGIEQFKALDDYYEHPNGWHVKVSVSEGYESKFYDFLRNFCLKRDLSFRDSKA